MLSIGRFKKKVKRNSRFILPFACYIEKYKRKNERKSSRERKREGEERSLTIKKG